MKKLYLVLAYKWFDKIKYGEKTEEYRECKPYWDTRFWNNDYDVVVFQRGYSKNAERISFKVNRIYCSGKPNDLNLKSVWVIELGEIIQEAES